MGSKQIKKDQKGGKGKNIEGARVGIWWGGKKSDEM